MNLKSARCSWPFYVFFAASFVGVTLRSLDWFTAIPGNFGDPRLNSIFLEHVYGWVMGRWPSLWSPQFFYPFENVLAFSDNHFGSVIFYIPWRLLDFSREMSMSLWIAIGCALNFISAYWVLRRLSFSALACGAGAFVFASSLPTLGEPDHAQLIYRFAIPLAFYYFWLAIGRKVDATDDVGNQTTTYQPALLGWALLWTAEQFYCSIYLGVFLVYLLIATAIAQFILSPKGYLRLLWQGWQGTPAKSKWIGIALSALSVIAIGALLLKYRMVAKDYGLTWQAINIENNLPTFYTYFGKTPFYLGTGLIAFIVFTILISLIPRSNLKGLRGLSQLSAIIALIMMTVTLKVGDFSLYHGLLHIPGIDSIRGVYRIEWVILWPIAILISYGVIQLEYMLQKITNKQTVFACVILFPLLCYESLMSPQLRFFTSHTAWKKRSEDLKEVIKKQPLTHEIFFSTGKLGEENALGELDAMILSQELNKPTVNGFSGHEPPGYQLANPCFELPDRIAAYIYHNNRSIQDLPSILSRIDVIKPSTTFKTEFNYASSLDQPIYFAGISAFQPRVLQCGWSKPEEWGVWSDQSVAKLVLALPSQTSSKLELKLRPFAMGSYRIKDVKIGINDQPLVSYAFNGTSEASFSIPLEHNTMQGFVAVKFLVDNEMSPKELGYSQDNRKLGVGLISAIFK